MEATSSPSTVAAEEISLPRATTYIQSLLNKKLRVHTTDTRIFVGDFKCTDNERNVILSLTYEYRPPPPPTPSSLESLSLSGADGKVKMDMTSRFLGLIVVPGQYISKIEVEGEGGVL
ncbi:MAG: hypothetical protein MMC33_009004 [Icmadophila ericetorum]|nr:hypothetical protein [Icmadophila ericetorum]